MKRILLFVVAAVLLPTATASADLMVNEYVTGSGEMVVLDTETGSHWYWNLADFVNKTYAQQITAIGDLGNYGHIAGGWHMASLSEMQSLLPYTGQTFVSSFRWPSSTKPFYGRYNSPGFTDFHYILIIEYYGSARNVLQTLAIHDSDSQPLFGAWVTTDAPVVPAPPAVVLATTGMLTGLLCMLGAKLRGRWRRR